MRLSGSCVVRALCVCVCAGEVDTAILEKCDPCMSKPCLNHGSCEADQTDGYRCRCSEGFKVST